jgi:lipoyl(octanoyl) transferase
VKINIVNLGKMDYAEALVLQEALMSRHLQGNEEQTLLLVEHPPVLTLGRRGEYANILLPRKELEANGISVYEVSRGGDVTYHGPGQLVGYPIVDLSKIGRDVKEFVWKVEEVFIRLLAEKYELAAVRDEKKYTGVWVGNEKITAIGIAVKRWITMHGFAFNINTQLEHFKWINPCGITDKGVTSLQKLLGKPLDFEKVTLQTAEYFCEVFGMDPVFIDKDTFVQEVGTCSSESRNG